MWLYLSPDREVRGIVSDDWPWTYAWETGGYRIASDNEVQVFACIAIFEPLGEHQLPLF